MNDKNENKKWKKLEKKLFFINFIFQIFIFTAISYANSKTR